MTAPRRADMSLSLNVYYEDFCTIAICDGQPAAGYKCIVYVAIEYLQMPSSCRLYKSSDTRPRYANTNVAHRYTHDRTCRPMSPIQAAFFYFRSRLRNHTFHPSNPSSTFPPTSYNQISPCPTFHSPHCAPHTSTRQTQHDCSPAAYSAASTFESPRHTPSTGRASQTWTGTTLFLIVAAGKGWAGT